MCFFCQVVRRPWGPVESCSDVVVRSGHVAGRTILLVGPFQRMYYLGERVLEWSSGPRRRRVPMDPPLVFWTHELRGQELRRGLRGTPAIRRTLALQPVVYQTFIRERLLPGLPLAGLVPQVCAVSFSILSFLYLWLSANFHS